MNSTVIEMAPESFFPGAEVAILDEFKSLNKRYISQIECFVDDLND